MQLNTTETLLTAQDLAGRWGIDRDTVYRIPARTLPYLRPTPRTRRYRPADVRAYEDRVSEGLEG